MAVIQGARYSWSDSANVAIDMSDSVSFLDPHEAVTLQLIGASSLTGVDEIKHEWLEETLRTLDLAVANDTSLNNTTDPVSFNVVAGTGVQLAVGDILLAESEQMRVTARSTDSITVSRAWGGTTAAAHVANTVVKIIGHNVEQDSAVGTARTTTKTGKYNYPFFYEDSVVVTTTEAAIRKYVEQNTADAQMARASKIFWRLLNRKLFYGIAVAPVSGTPGDMDGILKVVTTNAYAKAGAYLTYDMINVAARDVWNAGGQLTHALVNSFQKEQIDKFRDGVRMTTPSDRTAGDFVDVIRTNYGDIRVVLDRDVPADTVPLIDKTRIKVGPFKDHSFSFAQLPQTTRTKNTWQAIAQYTSEIRNENAHAKITGLATS